MFNWSSDEEEEYQLADHDFYTPQQLIDWGFMNAQGEVLSTIHLPTPTVTSLSHPVITTCKGGCTNDPQLGGFIFLTQEFYNILRDENEIARRVNSAGGDYYGTSSTIPVELVSDQIYPDGIVYDRNFGQLICPQCQTPPPPQEDPTSVAQNINAINNNLILNYGGKKKRKRKRKRKTKKRKRKRKRKTKKRKSRKKRTKRRKKRTRRRR